MFIMLLFGITIDEDVIYVDKDIDSKFVLECSIHGVLERGRAITISLL